MGHEEFLVLVFWVETRHGGVPLQSYILKAEARILLQVVAIKTHFQKILWLVFPGNLKSSLVSSMQQ